MKDKASNLEFSDLSSTHLLLLRLIGFAPLGPGPRHGLASNCLRLLTYACNILVTSMYICSIGRSLARTGRADVQVVAEGVGLCGVHSRFLIAHAHRHRLLAMLDEARSIWLGLSRDEKPIVKSFAAKSARVTSFYIVGCACTVLFYGLFSLARSAKEGRSLPYPFYAEVTATPGYELALLAQNLGVIEVCVNAVSIDTCIIFLIMLTCGYLRCLSCRLFKLEELGEHAAGLVRREIVDGIVWHQRIIGFCKELDKLTRLVFMSQLMSTTYNLSLIGLTLIGKDPQNFKCVTVLTLLVVQLFMCQWAPDVLVTESVSLAKSVYFIPTAGRGSKIAKLISILTMRSQRPIQLTAGGYIRLSMECFGSMISSALSFFAVLRSMK